MFIGKPSGLSAILRPAETILIVDSGYSIITWWHAADYPPFPLNNIFIEDTAYLPGLQIIHQGSSGRTAQEMPFREASGPNKLMSDSQMDTSAQ